MRHCALWCFHTKLDIKQLSTDQSGQRQELNRQLLGVHAPDWNLHFFLMNSNSLNTSSSVDKVC